MADFQKTVELIGVLAHPYNDSWDPDDYPVAGAMGCFAEESSADIHRRHKINGEPYVTGRGDKRRELSWEETKELIMRETSGRGHRAVLDLSAFVFSVDNLSRASTLFLCGPEYASHLQQSLRRATAKRGCVEVHFDPDSEMGKREFEETDSRMGNELMERQFELYTEMAKAGVSKEDARIILPLNTKTAITSMWNASELTHLKSMVDRMKIPAEVRDTVYQMYQEASLAAPKTMADREKNQEVLSWFPSSQLFAETNPTLERIAMRGKGVELMDFSKGLTMTPEEIRQAVEERDEALLSNLKHYHFSFGAGMSLMTEHQAIRQRTWNHTSEPLDSAVRRGVHITPKSVSKAGFDGEYSGLVRESLRYASSHSRDPEAQGVIPHALQVYSAIHINGWNAIHSIGKRTCKTAQWEIRGIARDMARKIEERVPELGKYSRPQGVLYGTCPEREDCGACGKR
jgi:thymidylate synthase (FAD)